MATNDFQTKTSQIPDTKKRGVKPAVAAVDIVELILKDHEPIKAAFEALKDTKVSRANKTQAYEKFVFALSGHARSEEQTLYVGMKEAKATRIEGLEGDSEHAIADQLVQEIHSCADDDEWTAKVKVLAELVEHHIQEEEEEMLPDFKTRVPVAERKELGQEYARLKAEFDSLHANSAKRVTKIVENKLN